MGQSNHPPFYQLIGDATENFYQLGLKDRDRHKALLNHAMGVIKTPWRPLDKAITQASKALMVPALEKHPIFKKKIEAYAEGIGEEASTLAMAYLVPELMCFMHKWFPGLPITPLGCSSIFTWDDKRDALVHGRILDFPFHGSFDNEERAVLYDLNDTPKMLSFHSAGFALPSITTMTENGVSFALHQKFGTTFNPNGTPVFELIHEMLVKCGSRKEVIRFLKKQKSITTWAFYMGFANGEVLSAEIDGDQLFYHHHQAKVGELLYFCNERENPKLINEDIVPYSFNSQNKMRKLCFEKKQKALGIKAGKNGFTAEHVMKLMGRAWEQEKQAPEDWIADPLTPSTLQTTCMMPGIDEALFLPGPGPKFFNGEVYEYKNSFTKPTQRVKTIKGKSNSEFYQKGMYHYMQCQVALDLKDSHDPYHHIQLAIDYLEGFPFQNVAKFYFYVLQYMNETHKKTLSQLYYHFKELEHALPPYLQDQCRLFIFRINRILDRAEEIKDSDFGSAPLKRIYHFEKKLPQFMLHKMTRTLMVPRPDLLDVFYPYVK